jgi:O-acetylhomoserine (thiol)-lyase
MSGPRHPGFDTLALHAGATPIHFTSSFAFRDADHAASLFNMERSGHVSLMSEQPDAVLDALAGFAAKLN